MKIGIDANPLTISFSCGTKNYTRNLLINLAKLDKTNEYVIFVKKSVKIPKQKNFKLVVFSNFLPFFNRQLLLPYFVKKAGVDIFHNMEPYGSFFLKHSKIITTVHDIDLKLTYPFFSKYILNRIYCEFSRWWIFKKSHSFIANSESTMKELKNSFGIKKSKPISFIYISYDKRIFFKKGAFKKNFLCMGDFAYRKNIKRVISAYSSLPSNIKNEHKLVVIASTLSSAEKFRKIAKKYNSFKNVKIYTAIDDAMLACLYCSSYIFIYPSLYEGFGLPILEAMASGCPVITSNYGAMKEIAGSSALLTDPKSEKFITDAILRVYKDEKLRKSLIDKGLKRVKKFSWLDTAEKTLELYNYVYKGSK